MIPLGPVRPPGTQKVGNELQMSLMGSNSSRIPLLASFEIIANKSFKNSELRWIRLKTPIEDLEGRPHPWRG